MTATGLRIVPHLWYDKEAREAAEFYTAIFPDSKVTDVTVIHGTPSGDCDIVSFELWGQEFMAISAGPHFTLNPSISFFVNFDPSLFCEPVVARKALRDMRLVLHEAGIDPARIVCEVTEQRTSSEAALHVFVRELRNHGFRIAIDDYGAEESGIQRINQLHPDIVKFDAHWISRLMSSAPGFALLETMVREFHARGISSLFEGLEEPWQLELAERCGVDMVQGYVLARPEIVPANFRAFAPPRQSAAEPAPAGPAMAQPRHPAEQPRRVAKRPAFGHRGVH
jgi:EAL domain-containing protein (putative c-di-GMP-specific phosphodiesterase class I)